MNLSFEKYQALAEEKISGYTLTGDERDILCWILDYFNGVGRDGLDVNKGLLIRGGIGVGKTITLKLIQRLLPDTVKFSFNTCESAVDLYDNQGEEGLSAFKSTKERLFDDLGTEQKGKHYGKEIEVMEKVILARYNVFQNHGIRTHFTTNLINDEVKEKYGERSYDRLKEMCNVIVWPTEKSKRGVGSVQSPIVDDKRPVLTVEKQEPLTDEQRVEKLQTFYQKWLDSKPGDHITGYTQNFEYAWDLRLFNFSTQAARRYINKALDSARDEYIAMKSDRNLRTRGINGLDSLRNITDTTPIKSIPGSIKADAEKLALTEWFEMLKEIETSPAQMWGENPKKS